MKRYSRTANLFDYQTMADGESGRYLLPDGSTAASTGVWAITDYIPINGTTFTLVRTSAGNAPAICLYDVNKTYLTGIAYNSNMTVTVSSSNNAKFARFSYLISSANPENLGEAMLVEGSTAPSSYIPYGNTWQTKNPPHYGTSTDTITTLPADIYADGTNATVGLVGNMSQTGTPSPSSPIQPSECGERTGNLWDEDYTNISGTIQYRPIYVGSGNFTLSTTIPYDLSVANIFLLSGDVTSGASTSGNGAWLNHNVTAQSVDGYVTIAYRHYHGTTSPVNCDTMLNSGSTALPYEPGGIKIPISSANTTTPVYLGEVETTRRIKKLVLTGEETIRLQSINEYNIANFYINIDSVEINALSSHLEKQSTIISQTQTEGFLLSVSSASTTLYMRISTSRASTTTEMQTWLSNQYTNGTPVTFWYTTEDTTTGIVNEPLRKIGNYADTVSGITIPTTTGKDTFDVLTTLKPSEVSLAYTGWHDASVKEWDGSEWQDEQPVSLLSASSRPTLTESTPDIVDITEEPEEEKE